MRSNVVYLDKNMGMCLIIWDRLFGTFQEEIEAEPVRYGLTSSLKDTSLLHTIFHEWKAIAKDLKRDVNWKTKLKYVLNPPGWSHDGSTLTSNQLRQAEQTTSEAMIHE
ncbi:MAG: hypothetical protein R2822_09740 [Spirosomataceae bacterium]